MERKATIVFAGDAPPPQVVAVSRPPHRETAARAQQQQQQQPVGSSSGNRTPPRGAAGVAAGQFRGRVLDRPVLHLNGAQSQTQQATGLLINPRSSPGSPGGSASERASASIASAATAAQQNALYTLNGGLVGASLWQPRTHPAKPLRG